MAEHIERERAKKVLGFAVGASAAAALDKVPAADVVEVVHGRWKKYVAVGKDMFGNKTEVVFACNCSVCGFDGRIDTNYCPNCGARMDGATDNNVGHTIPVNDLYDEEDGERHG